MTRPAELRERIKTAVMDCMNTWAAGEGSDELLDPAYGAAITDAALSAIEASGFVVVEAAGTHVVAPDDAERLAAVCLEARRILASCGRPDASPSWLAGMEGAVASVLLRRDELIAAEAQAFRDEQEENTKLRNELAAIARLRSHGDLTAN